MSFEGGTFTPYIFVVLAATPLVWLWTGISARRAVHLPGPPSKSLLFGMSVYITQSSNPGAIFEGWMKTYGSVFKLPWMLRATHVVVCDTKSIAHVFRNDTTVFVRIPGFRKAVEPLVGDGLLCADGENHKRQRRALASGFSNTTIKHLTPIFFESANKLRNIWDDLIDLAGENHTIIEVQSWIDRLSLDIIGLAGFSHQFKALDGVQSDVASVLEMFSKAQPSSASILIHFLQPFIPLIMKLPFKRNKLLRSLSTSARAIMEDLIRRIANSGDGTSHEPLAERCVLGYLLNHEATNPQVTEEEILSQMKSILIAGFDPPAAALTWALIELARRPDIQSKLREEITQHTHDSEDLSLEQLPTETFPLLEAVTCEVLRLHPAVGELMRMAAEDVVLPTTVPNPIWQNPQESGASNNPTPHERVFLPKGTIVTIPIHCINSSTTFWGPDAASFLPERWLPQQPKTCGETCSLPTTEYQAKEIQGHKHLLTFGDGPRMCIGKAFALATFKATLVVLVRNFQFDLPNGPETPIESCLSVMVRPKVAGEEGCRVPMQVRRVER